jgi:phospholipid/cholesterol/gamma-HCH transport system permease protein
LLPACRRRAPELDPSNAITIIDGVITLRFPLTGRPVARAWPVLLRRAVAARGRPLVLDVSAATPCDTAGAALLAAAMARHGQATLRGAAPGVVALVARMAAAAPLAKPAAGSWTFTGVARAGLATLGAGLAFLGESLVALVTLGARRRQFRASDIARLIDEAGVKAVPLLVLLGYLIGLILAFQSALPLRRFGAELFVVNAVALSLLRELGPLLAGVILAGRTGSAYAAELGTMKVNEELAALDTMGVSPMTMLVLPRLVAATLVAPVMALLLELAGLAGMLTVLVAFGFPLAALTTQLLRAVQFHDFWTGLFKAMCFGAVIAGIGCRAGMATGDGARAVGLSATRAVVGGIVASIVLDGVFSILLYRLGS